MFTQRGIFQRLQMQIVNLTFQVLIVFFICVCSTCAEDRVKGERLVGGQCEYKQYKGYAKIISITKKSDFDSYSHERYEVKFLFIPEQEIKEKYVQTEGKEFLLLLSNSSYPGQKFLEKYGIEIGKVFDCYIKVIIKGTCTPILFEFPSIRLDDYLEN